MNIIAWHSQKILEKVKQRVSQNMDKAAIYLQRDIVENFGSPSAMPDIGLLKRRRGGDFTKLKEKEWRRMQHSDPGDPPFVQTGHLRRSITFSAPSLFTRLVGSSLKPNGTIDGKPTGDGTHSYAYYLETGTGKMLARPYLHPALLRCKVRIRQLIAGG